MVEQESSGKAKKALIEKIRTMLPSLSIFSGLSIVIVYVAFLTISYALHPSGFSPIDNWLSDLGKYSVNTNGAIYYNAGCILTGIFLALFAAVLQIKGSMKKWQHIFIIISQLSGIVAGFGLVMTAIFSIDQLQLHSTWGIVMKFGLVYFITFLSVALIPKPRFYRIIGIFGLANVAIEMIYNLAANTPIMEWISIFGALAFVAVFTIFTTVNKKPE